jgi:hypothetical protein
MDLKTIQDMESKVKEARGIMSRISILENILLRIETINNEAILTINIYEANHEPITVTGFGTSKHSDGNRKYELFKPLIIDVIKHEIDKLRIEFDQI